MEINQIWAVIATKAIAFEEALQNIPDFNYYSLMTENKTIIIHSRVAIGYVGSNTTALTGYRSLGQLYIFQRKGTNHFI